MRHNAGHSSTRLLTCRIGCISNRIKDTSCCNETLRKGSTDRRITRVFELPNWFRRNKLICSTAQFWTHLVYKLHFETWILLFGSFGKSGQYEKKKWFWVVLSNFWGCFFQVFVGKKKIWNIVASVIKNCRKSIYLFFQIFKIPGG